MITFTGLEQQLWLAFAAIMLVALFVWAAATIVINLIDKRGGQ